MEREKGYTRGDKEVGIPLDVSSSGSAQILFFVPRDTLPHMDKKSTSTYFFQKKTSSNYMRNLAQIFFCEMKGVSLFQDFLL